MLYGCIIEPHFRYNKPNYEQEPLNMNKGSKALEALTEENRMLRAEVENYAKKVARLQKVGWSELASETFNA